VGAYSFTDNAIRDLDAICDLIVIDNPRADQERENPLSLAEKLGELSLLISTQFVFEDMAISSRGVET
jgi:hypothetical protein